ncbi:MAG: HAMP domain-containing histidine kinase [Lachnospiraceae bacterium]|nr:HAMP domain-containing histidine kinase [Lachnospiraceae bacterium]
MGLFKKKTAPAEQQMTASGRNNEKRKGLGRLRQEKPWIYRGILVSLAFAVLFSCCYDIFRSRAEKFEENPLESTDNIAWLYQNCYLLYRDLCNLQSEETLDYAGIYLETEEQRQWILDAYRRQRYLEFLDVLTDMETAEGYDVQEELTGISLQEALTQGYLNREKVEAYIEEGILDEKEMESYAQSEEIFDLGRRDCYNLDREIQTMEEYFGSLEVNFADLNSCYDYIIEDDATGKYVTNMSVEARNRGAQDQYFRISFHFDDAGNVTIGDDICGRDVNLVRKQANEAIRANLTQSQIEDVLDTFQRYGRMKAPAACTVTFAVSTQEWNARKENSEGLYMGRLISDAAYDTNIQYYSTARYYNFSASAYYNSGLTGILTLCMSVLALAGMFWPMPRSQKPWQTERVCAVSLEFLICFGTCLLACSELVLSMIVYVASGRAGGVFSEYLGISPHLGRELAMLLNIAALTAFAFCCWYVGICARALRELGLRRYIRQRSLIYRFFPFIKGKAVGAYEAMAHMDLTKNANRTIIKLLIVNAVILLLISSLWVGGFPVVVVYSVLLYIILRRYVSQLQKRYRILLKAVDEIAQGNLNVSIPEDLGIFEPFREQVFKIQDGLKKAVDTEVKSQRMKVELVTNMSHDLKTPLTAIITYINLLKEDGITDAQRREYLGTLERKSLRLKSLIEDLFEFSKASSQNVTLNIMDVDIMNLVNQVAFEMSDKIGEAGLDVRMNLTEEKVILPLDSQKTYRIYENLFGNIAKYALPGTRVYVNGFRIGDTVIITLKNISAQEITVDSSELTERFVRGDASRNTEGSGLGLAIAKSFMELQGGELTLEVDGDLFKATTAWHMPYYPEYPEALPNSQ